MSWLSQAKNWVVDTAGDVMGNIVGNPSLRRQGTTAPGFDPGYQDEIDKYNKANTMQSPQFGLPQYGGSPWDQDPRMQGIGYGSLLSSGQEIGVKKPTFGAMPAQPQSEPAGTDWSKWLGLGLQAAGTTADIYGSYQQGREVDKELKHRRKIEMEDREREMRTGRALQPFLQRYLSEGG